MASVSSSTSSTTTSLISSSATSSTSSTSTSDIDWSALIAAAVAARTAKADTIDLKVTDNEAQIAAYEELQSLLSELADAAQALRAPSGTSQKSTDVFQSRTAYLTANGDVDTASTVGVTAEAGADPGSYDITISQLAKAHKVTSDSVSSKTEDLGYESVLSLGTGDTLAAVTITTDMSLADIAEAINAESDASGIGATVLAVSSGSYKLVLTAADTGLPMSISLTSGDDILSEIGLTDDNGDFANVVQEAQSAIFTIDGIEITRSDNDVDDVIDGLTFYLYQTTGEDTSVTVEISTDLDAVKDSVQALVDAYNAFREFAYAQQQIPNDDNADTTVLFGDGTLRTISASITSTLTTLIGEDGMSLLGLSFDETNSLELDEDTLDDALLSDLDAVEALLAFEMQSSNSDLLLLQRGSDDIGSFTLDIVVDSDGSLASAAIDGDSSLFTVSGTRIIGAEGTKYEGYSFVWAGDESASVTVSTSTGLAELLYNIADSAADDTDGTLQTLIDNLSDYNDTLEAKSDDIRDKAAIYEDNLTALYAEYQAAIEAAESSLDYLTTLIDSWNASS